MARPNMFSQIEPDADEIRSLPGPGAHPRPAPELPRVEVTSSVTDSRPLPMPGKRRDELLQMVQQLFLAPSRVPLRSVVFCGVTENNSSDTCASTATVLAEQTSESVCLIDADLEGAHLSTLFGLNDRRLNTPFDGRRAQCARIDSNLFIAGTGVLTGLDGRLAPASELKRRVAMLSASFDYLLFDVPGANTSADASMLGQVVGSVVLVLAANNTRRTEARKAKSRIEVGAARVLGAVLT